MHFLFLYFFFSKIFQFVRIIIIVIISFFFFLLVFEFWVAEGGNVVKHRRPHSNSRKKRSQNLKRRSAPVYSMSLLKVRHLFFCNKTIGSNEIAAAQAWEVLNPEIQTHLFDDLMIVRYLLKNFGRTHVNLFKSIPDGPIRADFWRICVLLKEGGAYSDIDNVPLVPLKDFVDPRVHLVTCSSYWAAMRFHFNPNFIVAQKNCPVLRACEQWYLAKFQSGGPYRYWDWSVMRCFTDVLKLKHYSVQEGIFDSANFPDRKVQILQENPGLCHTDAHNMYNGKRIFNNRAENWDYETHKFKT